MNTNSIYDIAIIGAGAVGCAIARELSRYQLKIALIESNSDVGMGTSKANTAVWHTGYDAKPGSLESKLLKRSYQLMGKYLVEANIAHERIGGLLIAWNQEQFDALPLLLKQAHENGDRDVKIISADEIFCAGSCNGIQANNKQENSRMVFTICIGLSEYFMLNFYERKLVIIMVKKSDAF